MFVALREYWPGVVSGEMESLERISTSLSLLGIKPVKVPVGMDDDEIIRELNPLFVLDLHFDAPRIQTAFSVGALWNPLDYYDLWGGLGPWTNQLQHDLFVAANPGVAQKWIKLFQPSYNRGILPFNHSVPTSAIVKSSTDISGNIFYAGIGWDRGVANGHRHEEIFRNLDQLGLLQLYGPEKLADGTKPWRDFKSYVGQLPFDGTSVISALNKTGFGLCLSSSSHIASEIASNRVFETIAAGALPIVEFGMSFPFSLEGAIVLPPGQSPKVLAAYLSEQIRALKENHEDYASRVKGLQDRLAGGFTLDGQLHEILARVNELKSIKIEPQKVETLNAFGIVSASEASWKGGLDSLESNSSKFSLNLHKAKEDFSLNPQAWVVFTEDLDFELKLQAGLGQLDLNGVDVVHVPGTYQANGRMRFIPNDGTSHRTRTIDSFCVRADLLLKWLEDSVGCASIGAFLIALSADANCGNQSSVGHTWIKSPYFELRKTNPVHVVAFTSKLDEISLVALIRQGSPLTSSLARQALSVSSLGTNDRQSEGGTILETLAIEVSRLGLKRLSIQSWRFARRMFSKSSS